MCTIIVQARRFCPSGWITTLISMCLGLASSSISWGAAQGLHGRGFPVAVEMWDRSLESGRFIDFPNPSGYLINVVIFCALAHSARFVFMRLSAKLARKRPDA